MASHKIIKAIVKTDGNNFVVFPATDDYCIVLDGKGTVIGSGDKKESPITSLKRRSRWGVYVDLDKCPTPVQHFIKTLDIKARFPKCFEMLPRIPKGGAKIDSFNIREKQMLNELIQHGVIKKSKLFYTLK